ncbi:MAG: tRNA 2-thiocytidine biosynthesis TtcA family protein [Chlamydiales bacterium]
MLDISLPIPTPPWKKLGRHLESVIRKGIYEYQMLEGIDTLAIALSGGKDSLTLLFMLKAISGHGFPKLNLYAIHIRGSFSCGASLQDNLLEKICKKLEIPLIICQSSQKENMQNCYSCSRERRKLIFEAAKKVGATTVAFGHHRDDNAQTLLMNLFHKGEFAGNLPKLYMVDYKICIIRPLILVAEKNITQFAKEYGFYRLTCRCPIGQNSMRKKMDRLLSEMEELFPNIRGNIGQASLLYGSDKAKKK